jgi:F-type H+-transporting ATPase subunit gamma
MATLKELRNRIKSVKATQKITKAMKMVAASKLRRAREKAEAARPYAERMQRMLSTLSASFADPESAPKLLAGTGKSDVHLLVVATSDRGLCGGFNGSIARAAKVEIQKLKASGKQVKIICYGKKGYEVIKRDFAHLIIEHITDLPRTGPNFELSRKLSDQLVAMYERGEFDVATIIYNKFRSAISQEVTFKQVIPLPLSQDSSENKADYILEPAEDVILEELLPRNLSVQIFHALLENGASEQGARMTAMDNATRNAGDMIKNITLKYNRTRQAAITKELIEIISGAEAL